MWTKSIPIHNDIWKKKKKEKKYTHTHTHIKTHKHAQTLHTLKHRKWRRLKSNSSVYWNTKHFKQFVWVVCIKHILFETLVSCNNPSSLFVLYIYIFLWRLYWSVDQYHQWCQSSPRKVKHYFWSPEEPPVVVVVCLVFFGFFFFFGGGRASTVLDLWQGTFHK